MKKIIITIIIIIILITSFVYAIKSAEKTNVLYPIKEIINDLLVTPSFFVEEYISGLNQPTTMAFIDNDILVLQKSDGKVRLIHNGILQEEPVLDVEVANLYEQGLLGILVKDSDVYLYYTEADRDGGIPIGNHIYKYEWVNEKLVNPVLINVLPSFHPKHVGGILVEGLDGTIYAITGDQTETNTMCPKQIEQVLDYPCRLNKENLSIFYNYLGGELDDTGVIIRVGLNSSELKPSESSNPMKYYYAMGIRNSFGLAIDPFTGNLWQTENGPDKFDEINLIFPNFNSGWPKVMGPADSTDIFEFPVFGNFTYGEPKFSWERPVAPTAISFIESDKFDKYSNHVLVGSCIGGMVFMFELNSERDGFVFEIPSLSDKVMNLIEIDDGKIWHESMEEIVIARNLGCVTDIKFGPDGFAYLLSLTNGKIFKLIPP